MNAFKLAQEVEKLAMEDIAPFLDSIFGNKWIVTSKGRLSKELQKKYGDVFANMKSGDIIAIEIKAERKQKYGNFFLEWWSNRSRETPGWMRTLNADYLVYYFIEPKELYVIDFQNLKDVCVQDGKETLWLSSFDLREQKIYSQLNDTWGYCVKIDAVRQKIGFSKWSLLDGIQKIEESRKTVIAIKRAA